VTIASGSHVQVSDGTALTLADGTTMFGGTLAIESGSTLYVETSAGATLDGVNVIDNGNIQVDLDLSATLTVDNGTSITGGTLSIGVFGTVDVENGENGGATFHGVNVSDNGALDIGDVAPGAILTLDDGTTITGSETGSLTINQGSTLDVEPGSNDGPTGATFHGVNVSDNGALDIGDVASGAILTLDHGTTITGSETGSLTIHEGSTLDVEAGSDGLPAPRLPASTSTITASSISATWPPVRSSPLRTAPRSTATTTPAR
jgi:hypothetical protein